MAYLCKKLVDLCFILWILCILLWIVRFFVNCAMGCVISEGLYHGILPWTTCTVNPLDEPRYHPNPEIESIAYAGVGVSRSHNTTVFLTLNNGLSCSLERKVSFLLWFLNNCSLWVSTLVFLLSSTTESRHAVARRCFPKYSTFSLEVLLKSFLIVVCFD